MKVNSQKLFSLFWPENDKTKLKLRIRSTRGTALKVHCIEKISNSYSVMIRLLDRIVTITV